MKDTTHAPVSTEPKHPQRYCKAMLPQLPESVNQQNKKNTALHSLTCTHTCTNLTASLSLSTSSSAGTWHRYMPLCSRHEHVRKHMHEHEDASMCCSCCANCARVQLMLVHMRTMSTSASMSMGLCTRDFTGHPKLSRPVGSVWVAIQAQVLRQPVLDVHRERLSRRSTYSQALQELCQGGLCRGHGTL